LQISISSAAAAERRPLTQAQAPVLKHMRLKSECPPEDEAEFKAQPWVEAIVAAAEVLARASATPKIKHFWPFFASSIC
jgi:hypothetical protein